MKVVIVDEIKFKSNPQFYLKTLQEFCPEMTENSMLDTLKFNGFYVFAFNNCGDVTTWGRCAKTWNRKTMYCIRQIETKDEYRGEGYATLCYKACEDYLIKKDENARTIYTFVDKDNLASIKFHEKLGFVRNDNASKYLTQMHGWDTAYMFVKTIERECEK